MADAPTVHASAVLAGARAVLIRGDAGAGKSRLAYALINAGRSGLLHFARLVGDDRVQLESCHGRLLVRPALTLQGLIEIRGIGIRQLAFEPIAVVGLVVDLTAAEEERLPDASESRTIIHGVDLPRLAVASAVDPLPRVLARLAEPSEVKPA